MRIGEYFKFAYFRWPIFNAYTATHTSISVIKHHLTCF